MNKVMLMALWFCEIGAMQSNGKVRLNQGQLTQQQSEFVDQLERIMVNNVKTDDNGTKTISDQVIIWTKAGILEPQVIEFLKHSYEETTQTFICDFPDDNTKKFKIDVKNNKISVISAEFQTELKVLASGKLNQKDFIENKNLVRKSLDQLELEIQRYKGLIALVITIIGGVITIYKVLMN